MDGETEVLDERFFDCCKAEAHIVENNLSAQSVIASAPLAALFFIDQRVMGLLQDIFQTQHLGFKGWQLLNEGHHAVDLCLQR